MSSKPHGKFSQSPFLLKNNMTITGHNPEASRLGMLPSVYAGKQQCKLDQDSEATDEKNIKCVELSAMACHKEERGKMCKAKKK